MTSADEISDTLGHLHQVLRRAATRRDGERLPDAQVEVLRLVERQPGIRVRDAAEALRTAPNTVSTLVGDLANAGLIARERSPENRREVRLTLTDEARRRIDAYQLRRRALVADALDRLGDDARDRIAAAVPDLRRLVQLLTDGPRHGRAADSRGERAANPQEERVASPREERAASPQRETAMPPRGTGTAP
ncbi:MarR family winged helix-turn-helix transcriptional regulator [Catenuloplanes atrovinosus]|uniref:DNA-binding MarR family transcriptional regulator n=1 Tax=Catenuloplanes atrovinosus TaxID=137266 RepID=A0AAE4C8U1_9ACTN|nr:MarR family transcriptional regulator [Catenuloplanes atrovinosus]MDR7274154.1 DNA-binding MarR family transcriptional regulator [Catenuloplanes atrovinosus]